MQMSMKIAKRMGGKDRLTVVLNRRTTGGASQI